MDSVPVPRHDIARRILGRSQLKNRVEQLARNSGRPSQRSDQRAPRTRSRERVAALTLTLDGVSASVDRLHATIVAADPQMMRSVLESVRHARRHPAERRRQLTARPNRSRVGHRLRVGVDPPRWLAV
ncbi:MAG: hypothetical protein V9G12_19345, partial [Microthrixaceae bacterium]